MAVKDVRSRKEVERHRHVSCPPVFPLPRWNPRSAFEHPARGVEAKYARDVAASWTIVLQQVADIPVRIPELINPQKDRAVVRTGHVALGVGAGGHQSCQDHNDYDH